MGYNAVMLAPDRAGLLFRLQQLDQETDQLRQRLDQTAAALAHHALVDAARSAEATAAQALQACREKQQQHAFELAQLESKLTSHEQQLYSGRGSPRDLENLRRDVEHLRQQRGAQEEQVLLAMEAVEEAAQLLESRRGEARRAIAEARRREDELAAARDQVQTRLRHLTAERDTLATRVDAAARSLYERLRPRMAGLAVAEVVQGRCTGCRINLPATELQRARRGQDLVQCSTCGRILHVQH